MVQCVLSQHSKLPAPCQNATQMQDHVMRGQIWYGLMRCRTTIHYQDTTETVLSFYLLSFSFLFVFVYLIRLRTRNKKKMQMLRATPIAPLFLFSVCVSFGTLLYCAFKMSGIEMKIRHLVDSDLVDSFASEFFRFRSMTLWHVDCHFFQASS